MSDSKTQPISFTAPEIAELAPLFEAYTLERLIASGGMGAVYRAIQKSLDRTVAIKILPQEFGKDAAFAASFEAEAKAMARLSHPNLIGVIDFGGIKGILFIVMEYVPGGSLYQLAHGRALEASKVISLVTGICSGLSHAHKFGIIHRDIKPSNILLDHNTQPKIGDFGLARAIRAKIPDSAAIFGTPYYTAPEVISNPQAVGHRADIYSVGILLHELLTGHPPADDPRPASTIVKCDPRFDDIIRRATDPRPELRYFSADEIIHDLQAITRPAGAKAHGTPATPSAPRAAVRGNTAGPKGAPRKVLSRSTRPVTYRKQLSLVPAVVITVAILLLGVLAYNRFGHKPTPLVEAPATPPQTAAKKPEQPAAQPEPQPESKIHFEVPPQPGAAATTQADSDDFEAKPKADVPALLSQTRKVMQELADPISKLHTNKIKNNFWAFGNGASTAAGSVKSNRAASIARVEKTIEKLAHDGARVPDVLISSLASLPDLRELHAKTLEEQQNIDFEYRRDIAALTSTYLLGLRKQSERLKQEKDPGAVRLIDEEVAKVRDDPEYFVQLMLGSEFDQVKAKHPEN